jgi:Ras family protein A
MHFCAGLPIILVGCKIDLRHDPKIIDELSKASQRPTTPEEVCLYSALLNDSAFY